MLKTSINNLCQYKLKKIPMFSSYIICISANKSSMFAHETKSLTNVYLISTFKTKHINEIRSRFIPFSPTINSTAPPVFSSNVNL